MTDLYFVDSNVLVYRRDSSEPTKQPRAEAWLRYLWTERLGTLSVQVLQEYYQVVTRKLSPGLTAREARKDVDDFWVWQPVPTLPSVLRHAWQVEDDFGLSWWDSLIVSAAHHVGATRLLTEDLQDGQDLGGLLVVNPFENDPPEP